MTTTAPAPFFESRLVAPAGRYKPRLLLFSSTWGPPIEKRDDSPPRDAAYGPIHDRAGQVQTHPPDVPPKCSLWTAADAFPTSSHSHLLQETADPARDH